MRLQTFDDNDNNNDATDNNVGDNGNGVMGNNLNKDGNIATGNNVNNDGGSATDDYCNGAMNNGVNDDDGNGYRRALLKVISIANLWVYLGFDQCCFLGRESDISQVTYWWFLVIAVCLLQAGIPGNLHTLAMIISI